MKVKAKAEVKGRTEKVEAEVKRKSGRSLSPQA
jgi:hypothetical protein